MSLGVRAGLQSSQWVIDYSDQDLTFFMVVFRNFELAKATLQERRSSCCSPRIYRPGTLGGCRPACSKARGSGRIPFTQPDTDRPAWGAVALPAGRHV